MARPIRVEAEGAVYHVMARGNEQKAIFRDDSDREEYLRRLARFLLELIGSIVYSCIIDPWLDR